MILRFTNLAFAALIFASIDSSAQAPAQIPNSIVNVNVLDRTGARIAGASITFRDAQSAITKQTAADGSFKIGLRLGRYVVVASAPGFETATNEFSVDASTTELQINLDVAASTSPIFDPGEVPIEVSRLPGELLEPALHIDTEPPAITVRRPTVVAFFPPVSAKDLNDGGTNEALADFQYYTGKSRGRLLDAGIDLEVIYARSFRIAVGNKTILLHPGKLGVGYCFVGRGSKAHFEYGVMTDGDLFTMAKRYFAISLK